MALARLKSLERLRYCAPGEWGKLLGLDRVPEVRTMRAKVNHLAGQGKAAEWSADLFQNWMTDSPEQATAFYIDGHVRVYHGDKAQLPKAYVAREKLCLRASTDYWVNAMDGQPFFVVYQVFRPVYFIETGDHRQDDLNIVSGGCTQNCTYLRPKISLIGKTQTDCAKSKRRIGLAV